MILSDKEFLNRLKLLFSSLFARSMTKVVVGCPGLADNIFLFSNIKKEEIEYYEPSAEYFLHQVEILDSDFISDLFEQFEVFKKATFILYTDKFLSVCNKHLGPLMDLKVGFNGTELYICAMGKDNLPIAETCGELISEYTASQYKRIFDDACINNIDAKTMDIKDHLSLDDKYTIIDAPFFTDRLCKATIVANQSGVSMKEFPSKAKLEDYQYQVLMAADGSTVKINTEFHSPLVNVKSVQPHMIWFTKPKEHKEKENGN